MSNKYPLCFWTSKELNEALKNVNPPGKSTATGAAACWFAQRAYEDSIRKAHRDGTYLRAVEAGLITQQEVNKLIKSLTY